MIDGVEVTGTTINVSESGMLVRLGQALEPWVEGEIFAEVGEYYLSIGARVARVQDRDAGLSFLVETDNDRQSIEIMLEFAQPELSQVLSGDKR